MDPGVVTAITRSGVGEPLIVMERTNFRGEYGSGHHRRNVVSVFRATADRVGSLNRRPVAGVSQLAPVHRSHSATHLEVKLQRQLQLSLRAAGAVYRSELCGIVQVVDRNSTCGCICNVERLGPELKASLFIEGKILEQ